MKPKTLPESEIKPLSLRLTSELKGELAEAEQETGLSQSDLARLALQRGLKILRAQLKHPVAEFAAA